MVFNFLQCQISLKQLTDRPTSTLFSRPRSEGSHAFRNDKRDFPYNKCPSSKIVVTQPPTTTITELQCKAVLSDPVRYGPSGQREAELTVAKCERKNAVALIKDVFTSKSRRIREWSEWINQRGIQMYRYLCKHNVNIGIYATRGNTSN